MDDAVFLHGVLEGIAGIETRAYAVMESLGAPHPKRILTTGGGAANPVWTEIRARILGIQVTAAATTEAAVGTARLAGGARLP